jgi:hypothetical protein
MTTSKKDASEAASLMHDKRKKVRSVAASDLAQAKRHHKRQGKRGGRKSSR